MQIRVERPQQETLVLHVKSFCQYSDCASSHVIEDRSQVTIGFCDKDYEKNAKEADFYPVTQDFIA